MLAKIHNDYRDRGVDVVAVNIEPSYSLSAWVRFWKSKGAGDVIWGQDAGGAAVRQYQLFAVGSEVMIDRQGRVVFRSNGPAGPQELRSEVERHL